MKKLILIILLFSIYKTSFCQNLNLTDLNKLNKLKFEQQDEYLTLKNYTLLGKDITDGDETCTDWIAGNTRKYLTPFSSLVNNSWMISQYNTGRLEYTTYSKANYLQIKKSLSSIGFKYVSIGRQNGNTFYTYKNQNKLLKLYILHHEDDETKKYEGDLYQVILFPK
jgi:hypothetical protein